jgi:micrococcal nuclease
MEQNKLLRLCFGKMVRIESTGKDSYGRALAYVYVGDTCINKELLKLGMVWHFKKYNNDSELAKLETEAREKKIGLWSQANTVAPWDWRLNN